MLLDARKKEEMLKTARGLCDLIAELEVGGSEPAKSERIVNAKSCRSCEHWDAGCKLADFAAPPEDVQAKGCDMWVEFDEIPF